MRLAETPIDKPITNQPSIDVKDLILQAGQTGLTLFAYNQAMKINAERIKQGLEPLEVNKIMQPVPVKVDVSSDVTNKLTSELSKTFGDLRTIALVSFMGVAVIGGLMFLKKKGK